MISEEQQDQAALYSLGSLEAEEARQFEAAIQSSPELRELVREMREAAASLALTAPAQPVPPMLRSKVVRQTKSGAPATTRFARPITHWMPWALAACLALSTAGVLLWHLQVSRELVQTHQQLAATAADLDRALKAGETDRQRIKATESQLAELTRERDRLTKQIAQLKEENENERVQAAKLTAERDTLSDRIATLEKNANTQLATLTSRLSGAPNATASVLWDSAKQQGVLQIRGLPPTIGTQDYQLWIADPHYPGPVDSGVFSVRESGTTEIIFKPKRPVSAARAFLVSRERKGGVTAPQGPIVLASN